MLSYARGYVRDKCYDASSQAEANCGMFIHADQPATASSADTYACLLMKEAGWDIPQAEWEPESGGGTITVGPKSGCRRPGWAR